MNRRYAIRNLTLGAAGLLLPRFLMADQNCTQIRPFFSRCTAGISSELLDQEAADPYQHRSEWCWAACISMIFGYFDHAVSQETIVQKTWGDIVNMPADPVRILKALNGRWVDDDGNKFRVQTHVTNNSTAVRDLQNDSPSIIGALGHAMVLTAVTSDVRSDGAWNIIQAVVRDPWPGNGGRRALSGVEWANIGFAAGIDID